MTLADKAALTSRLEAVGLAPQLLVTVLGQLCEGRLPDDAATELGEAGVVTLHDPSHPGEPSVVRPWGRRPVQGGDCIGQWRHRRERQLVPGGESLEEVVLPEASHFDQPFDRLSGTAEGQTSSRLPGNGDDPTVQLWRGAAVEEHFLLATLPTTVERREIDVVEPHRSF